MAGFLEKLARRRSAPENTASRVLAEIVARSAPNPAFGAPGGGGATVRPMKDGGAGAALRDGTMAMSAPLANGLMRATFTPYAPGYGSAWGTIAPERPAESLSAIVDHMVARHAAELVAIGAAERGEGESRRFKKTMDAIALGIEQRETARRFNRVHGALVAHLKSRMTRPDPGIETMTANDPAVFLAVRGRGDRPDVWFSVEDGDVVMTLGSYTRMRVEQDRGRDDGLYLAMGFPNGYAFKLFLAQEGVSESALTEPIKTEGFDTPSSRSALPDQRFNLGSAMVPRAVGSAAMAVVQDPPRAAPSPVPR